MTERFECANCGRLSEHDDGLWHPGEFCLFGTLYMCSERCALEYVDKHTKPGYFDKDEHLSEPGNEDEVRDAWVEMRIEEVVNRIQNQPAEQSLDEFERLARMLVIECGDADAVCWPADLQLSDVLEKHLVRKLHGRAGP